MLIRPKFHSLWVYVGRNVQKSPHIVKIAWQDQHEIAIHSFDRSFPPFFSYQTLQEDIRLTQNAIDTAAGEKVSTRLYRPPRGLVTPPVKRLIKESDFQLGYLSFYVPDASASSEDAEKILSKMKHSIKKHKGAAIVFHETRFKRDTEKDDKTEKAWLAQAVEELIIWAKKEGYTFSFYPETIRNQ